MLALGSFPQFWPVIFPVILPVIVPVIFTVILPNAQMFKLECSMSVP